MDPNASDSLNIRPIIPVVNHSTDNNRQAAAQARLDIASATSPVYQGSIPARLTSAPALPRPISPAEENLRRLPKVPTTNLPHFGKAKPILSALASFLFILTLFKAPVFYSQVKYLLASHSAAPITVTNASVAAVVGPDPIITIPKINVSAPIIFPTTTADTPNYDPELENGVVHFPDTAFPGQNGNSVIFGHSSNDWWEPGSYKFVFVLLDKLVVGDTFSINYNSRRYIYQVTGTKVVEATDLSVLAPTTTPTVTLITCWPAGTSLKREIITAKQISPTTSASSQSTTQPSGTTVLPSGSPSLWQEVGQFWQGIKDGLSGKATNVSSPNTTPTTPSSSTQSQTLPGSQ